jgi:hypothetical protein
MDEIREMVGVEVGFWGSKMIPMRFMWHGRRHEIKRVTIKFEREDGGRKYLCFGVDTGGMLAELLLDRQSLVWRVGKCEPYYM